MKNYDFLIVGAGLFGCVTAEQLAKKGKTVLLIDSRSHIGGNCHSEIDEKTGIEFHTYGTHIFHTQSKDIWDYVNSFTPFSSFEHRVVARIDDQEYPLPFNLDTFSLFFGKEFTPDTLETFLSSKRVHFEKIENLEQQGLSLFGKEFYEAFIKGYTEKHWGVKAAELPASILSRIPLSFDKNRNYFKRSAFQGLPEKGYQDFFSSLTSSSLIDISLNTDFFSNKDSLHYEKLIYSGPIDRYFNNCFGELKWRGIKLTKEYVPYPSSFYTPVCNFPKSTVTKTRTHVPRLLYPKRESQQSSELLLHEESCCGLEAPFYPMRVESQMEQLKKYEQLKAEESNVFFGGRLASYAYMDMDQVISQALVLTKRIE